MSENKRQTRKRSTSSSSSSKAPGNKKAKVSNELTPYERICKDLKLRGDKFCHIVVGLKVSKKVKGASIEEAEESEEEGDSEDEEEGEDDDLTYEQMKAKLKVIYVGKEYPELVNQFYRNLLNADCRHEKLHEEKNAAKLARLA